LRLPIDKPFTMDYLLLFLLVLATTDFWSCDSNTHSAIITDRPVRNARKNCLRKKDISRAPVNKVPDQVFSSLHPSKATSAKRLVEQGQEKITPIYPTKD